MNIGILIPTIKGREEFLKQAMNLISEQTVKPTFIEIVNKVKKIDIKIDVAYRYKVGIERCKKKGADVIIFWEDDDWYKYNYIEVLIKNWILYGRPDIFGISKTIYYHIVKRKYVLLEHPKRASMMSTMITRNVIPQWDEFHDQYVDIELWRSRIYSSRTMDMSFDRPIAVGIKHGIGETAGGGHKWNSEKFNHDDKNLAFLSKILDKDSLDFYSDFYGKK